MKKLLLVLGLVAMFSLTASAKKTPTTTYNFQFLTVNGDPYCDGMFLKNYGNPQTLVDGYHTDPTCVIENGFNVFLAVNGFLAPVDPKYQYGGSGNVMIVSDTTLEASGECFSPFAGHNTDGGFTCEAASGIYPATVYLINPTTNTWTLWVSGGGTGEYVVNWGTIQPVVVGPLNLAKPAQGARSAYPRPSFAR
jgi:hypothetical protein